MTGVGSCYSVWRFWLLVQVWRGPLRFGRITNTVLLSEDGIEPASIRLFV
jgi:hypothetical protein